MRPRRRIQTNDVWERFSASKLSSFVACPMRGVFEYVLNIPAPQNPSAVLGQALHYTFYLFFRPHPKTKRFPYQTPEALAGVWKGFWWGAVKGKHGFGGRRSPADEVAWQYPGQDGVLFAAGLKILNTFFAFHHDLRLDGRMRLAERRFLFTWHNLRLSGIVDRLDVEEDGVVLTDYKNGKYADHLLATGIQMTLYQLAYEMSFRKRLPGRPPLKAIRIYDYRNGQLQDAPLRSPYEFGMFLSYLQETADYLRGVFSGRYPSIERMMEFRIYDPADMLRGDVTPVFPRGDHCTFCRHYRPCRSWELGERSVARLSWHEQLQVQRLEQNPNQLRLSFPELPIVRLGEASIQRLLLDNQQWGLQQSLSF